MTRENVTFLLALYRESSFQPSCFSCQAISFLPTTRKTLFFYLNFYIFVTSACDELIKISCAHKFLFSRWKMIKNSFLSFRTSEKRFWHENMKILIISCITIHLSNNNHHKHKLVQSSLCVCMSYCSCLIMVELKE